LPDNTSVSNSFYPDGNLKLTYGSRAYPVGYSYDAQGRLKTMTNWSGFSANSGARVTTWNYDTYRGWLSGKTYDGGAAGPAYTYTAAGRLATRAWARAITTTYSYNYAGDLSGVAYSDGVTPNLAYDYDRRGRQTSVTQGGSITAARAYDDAGNLLSETWTGGPLGGVAVTNGFDSLLRRTAVGLNTQPSALVKYGYDGASRLSRVTNGTAYIGYTYLANSPLVGQIGFTNSGLWMSSTRQYDNLNRLTQTASTRAAGVAATFSYGYNAANQRSALTNADSSFWAYQYDSLGQVVSGRKYWSDASPVAGQQFEYGFDDIGNRLSTAAGGDPWGANLRYAAYSPNNLNQYASRTVPGAVDVLGSALSTATVTVNNRPTQRKGDYYWAQLELTNTAGPVYQPVTNLAVLPNGTNADIVTNSIGSVFVAKSLESYGYDADGNLTGDGRWTFTWDGENRLVSMQGLSTLPVAAKLKVDFTYDYQGRRMQKIVSTNNGTSYVPQYTNRFAYDGWNLVAVLGPTGSLLQSFVWGTDLSGSLQGAGGVGGLLLVNDTAKGLHFPCFDGNGNVAALVKASDGTVQANYEYGPFGEVIRATGPMAKANPFRFSTKYQDDETDLLYYDFRYYNAGTGRWLSRDPIGEPGGVNLYCMVGNNPVTRFDAQGLTDWGDVIPGWWDAIWNTFDWALGHSGSTDYGPDSLQSRQMSQSAIAGQLRAYFLNKNKDKLCKDWKGVSNFKTRFRVLHEVIVDGFNGTAEFVGDARGDVAAKKDLVNCKIKAEFHFTNVTSLRSLLYGVWPDSWNVTLPGFPFANWTQFYTWNETFDCNCCHTTGVGGSW
jgi:RHS repeat-associated protein